MLLMPAVLLVIGLSGGAAGALALRKSRSYGLAFLFGSAVLIALGTAAVPAIAGMTCGGSVSLLGAVLTLVFYLLVRTKTALPAA